MASVYRGFLRPPEAPVFEPTIEEFRDPFLYLAKIRPLVEPVGLCKIRPPSTWQPPFAADIDKFVFTPRVQQLNMLEAKSRIKLRFMDHLTKFWQLQGIHLKVPKIEQKSLDLYSLHKIVEEEGGFEMISRDGNWSKVVARLGCQTMLTAKNVASIVQHHYEKILYPYDIFLAGATFDSKDVEESDSSDEDDSSDDDDVVFVKMEMSPTSAGASSSSAGDAKHDVKSDFKPSLKLTCSGDGPQVESKTDHEPPTMPAKAGKNHVNLAAFSNELKKLQFLGAGPKMALPDIGTIVDEAFRDHSDGTKYKRRQTRDKKLSLCESANRTCATCGSSSHADELLVCDSCRHAFHNFCLIPPLKDAPRKVWRCAKCIAQVCRRPNMAFGFRQADCEYSLQSFGEMADKFKSEHFGVPIHTVSCATVETEFWRLVHSIDDDVSVEYGADNPVGDEFGSGFPTEKTRHLFPDDDDYISSPWNLNNMPVHKKSLLRYINADISGMKVPWCYVGMCFTCFAWHTEDHWSYSVNYLHWGEPKTWYGVPGCDAEKLERVMKAYAPELFEQSPDLIHQLTTIMDPTLLMAAGVSVVRTDQHAGEIVFTFPRSYHAGFNQGYNFAEAVNFAIADWLPMGRASVDHYRQLKRQLVFSHDEMVCKMAGLPVGTLDPHEVLMTYQDMLVMVEEEKRLRKIVFDKGTVDAEREAFELLPDDERQCEVCKTTCFLSAITCDCSEGKLACINDADELCRCHASRRCLRYRFTLNELLTLLSRLKDFIDQFNSWAARARAIVRDTSGQRKSDVTELRQLMTEAETGNYVDTAECESLLKSVAVVDRCEEIAARFRSYASDIDTKMEDGCEPLPQLTVQQLQELQDKLDDVCCTVPDGPFLKDLLGRIKKFQADVSEAVAMDKLDAEKLRTLLKSDLLIHVDLQERTELKKAIQQLDWLDEVNRTMSPPVSGATVLTLTAVRKLVESGVRLGKMHPSCAKTLAELQQTFTTNSTCEQKAARYLVNRPYQPISTLEVLFTKAKSCSLTLPSVIRLTEAVDIAKAWNTEADQLLCQPDGEMPWFNSVNDLVARGRLIPVNLPHLPKLESHLLAARGWLELAQRSFLLGKFSASLLQVLSPLTDSVDQGKEQQPKNVERFELDQLRLGEARELSIMCDMRARNLASVDNVHPTVRCQLCCYLLEASESRGAKSHLCTHCHRTRCPKLSEILSLLTSLKRLYVRLPEGILLQRLADRASQWTDRVRAVLADESVLTIVRLKENNRNGNTIDSIADCIENCPPADDNTNIQAALASTSSKEAIEELVRLMIEGDLMQVELCEKESLRSILATCCPDVYRLPPPIPETNQAKRKMSLDDDVSAKTRRSSCSSSVSGPCIAATKHEDATDVVVILDSDDDDNVAEDEDVEGCAADVCLKPIGDDLLWIQCSECDRCYHFPCVGLDSKSSSGCPSYICGHCVPAVSTSNPSANASGFCSRNGSTDDSLSGIKQVLAQLGVVHGQGPRAELGKLLVPISRNSSAKPVLVNRVDDDVIVIE